MVTSICIQTSSGWDLQLLYIFLTLCIIICFHLSHSGIHIVVSHCDFVSISLVTNHAEHFFLFFFIFKLYTIVLVLPYINMNVLMCLLFSFAYMLCWQLGYSVYLTKEGKDLFAENYKIPLKKTEDNSKRWKDIFCS